MPNRKPNIILFLADDMGFSDIGCFGAEINTPHLDALASRGLRFTQMYNVARCCPSRAALLTGLYPHKAGVGHMVRKPDGKSPPAYQGYLNDSCITLAEALKIAGYRTGMSGKWHVGGAYGHNEDWKDIAGTKGYPTPLQRGFDRFYGTLEGAGNYYNPVTLTDGDRPVKVTAEEDFYYTERIGEKACEMIDEFSAGDSPFFLYVAFNAPHWPLHAREADIKKYEGTYKIGWDRLRRERYRRQVEMGIVEDIWDVSPRDEEAPDWESVEDKDWEDIKMAVYAAQIEAMDRSVGQVLSRLEETGTAGNTLVLFLSDNGGCAEILPEDGWILSYAQTTDIRGNPVEVGNRSRRRPGGEDTYMSYGLPWANASNTPFRLFKHWIHEGGISGPCIVSWPDRQRKAGQVTHTPVHFIDIMQTLLDAAGTAFPDSYQGRSLEPPDGETFLPALSSDWSRRTSIFWEHEGNCGMRRGRYKLVRKFPGPYELYDIVRDRTELHDLAAEQPEIVAEMRRAYDYWAEKTGVEQRQKPAIL